MVNTASSLPSTSGAVAIVTVVAATANRPYVGRAASVGVITTGFEVAPSQVAVTAVGTEGIGTCTAHVPSPAGVTVTSNGTDGAPGNKYPLPVTRTSVVHPPPPISTGVPEVATRGVAVSAVGAASAAGVGEMTGAAVSTSVTIVRRPRTRSTSQHGGHGRPGTRNGRVTGDGCRSGRRRG